MKHVIVDRDGRVDTRGHPDLYLVLHDGKWRVYPTPGEAIHAARQLGPEAIACHTYLSRNTVTLLRPERLKIYKAQLRKFGLLTS